MARVACLFSIEYYDSLEHPLPGWDKIPFGLSVIAACLEEAGHEVQCWVLCPDSPLDTAIDEIVNGFRCDLVAASAVTTQFPLIAVVCAGIKSAKPSIPVLLGGVHATICPQECIAHPAIDALCVGEGEDVAVAWANSLSRGDRPTGIPGAWIKNPGTGEIERTPPAPFRTDLDDLPLVNYAHWERWVDPDNRLLRVVVGRGCPYACAYCSNHALRAVQAGPYVRFRSPDNILSEMEMLVRRFPDLWSINLEIETIGASVHWAIALCDALAAFNATRKRPIVFGANLAVTTPLLQREAQLLALLEAFKRANLLRLRVGLESGSPRIRKEILNRPPYSNDELVRFSELAREHGIDLSLYIMIGVPTETPEEAMGTSAVARALNPAEIDPAIYYPYPGTKLFEMSARMHLIDPRQIGYTAERSRVYLKLKNFPRWKVFLEYILMHWRVFHGRRNAIAILRTMISRTLACIPDLQIAVIRSVHNLQNRRAS